MGIEATGADLRDLRSLLTDAGYQTERVRQLLALSEPAEAVLANTGRYSFLHADSLADVDDEAAILCQLFLFSVRVPAGRLERLDPRLRHLLWRLDLVEPAGEPPGKLPGLVRGRVAVTELRGRYFLSDPLFDHRGGDLVVNDRADACMPPHASSLELLTVLRRPPGATSFLDVGCGSGCHSILLADSYDVVAGIDVSPRSVRYARANAVLNGVDVRYLVGRGEGFHGDGPYDHVSFNSPDSDTAFAFINSGLAGVLAPCGDAQILICCEVTETEGSLDRLLRSRIRDFDRLSIDVSVNLDSAFSLRRDLVRTGKLPYGTLLVSHPSAEAAYLAGLAARRVVEIANVVLTIRLDE